MQGTHRFQFAGSTIRRLNHAQCGAMQPKSTLAKLGLAFAAGGGKAPKKTEACTPLNVLLPASFDGFRLTVAVPPARRPA